MSAYSLNICIPDETLTALNKSSMKLYAFKGANGPPDLVSTVWFSEASLYEQNVLTYEGKHDSFISEIVNIDVESQIVSSTAKPMEAGQTANVADDNTIVVDKSNGVPNFYSFLNTGTSSHTCGLSNVNPAGVNVPICATPLRGGGAVGIEPIEKIYLCFSDQLHNVGSVLLQTSSPGYVVDLTDPSMYGAEVTFDMDKGWSSAPAVAQNCTKVPANQVFGNILNSK